MLRNGRIEEKTTDPSEVDLDAVSNACDIIRQIQGLRTHSRISDVLIGECIRTNDPAGWAWMQNDIDIGKFHPTQTLDNGEEVFECLVQAREFEHAKNVASCSPRIKLSEVGFRRLQLTFAHRWQELLGSIDALTRYELSERVVDVIECMKGFVAYVSPTCADACVVYLLQQKRTALLPMFERANVTPAIIPDVLLALKASEDLVLIALLCKAAKEDRTTILRVDGGTKIVTDVMGTLVKRPAIDKKTALLLICLCKTMFTPDSLSSHLASLALSLCACPST